MLYIAAAVLAGYLAGSIPSSVWLGKLIFNKDIRSLGSGNAGATNVLRNWGWKPALVVLLADLAKGWLPAAWFATWWVGDSPWDRSALNLMVGSEAVLGHVFPIFAGLRGGKGVATAGGVVLGVYPAVFPICLLTFLAVAMRSRIASLASLAGALALPVGLFALSRLLDHPISDNLILASLSFPAFLLFTHRGNIYRLSKGTERRFGQEKETREDLD